MEEKSYENFEKLFRLHHKELLSLSVNILRDRDAAKDILQDVFMKLWNNREKIDFGAQIKHYLFKATVHTSYNYLRSGKNKQSLDLTTGIRDLISPSGEETAEFRELDNKVRIAIDRLPPKCKIIYILCRHEGLKYQEIADTLDLSIKTVENQMGIALQKLREELKPFLFGSFAAILVMLLTLFSLLFSINA
jgi:RNA polymerase sigma-70 factor, ECF subfamily